MRVRALVASASNSPSVALSTGTSNSATLPFSEPAASGFVGSTTTSGAVTPPAGSDPEYGMYPGTGLGPACGPLITASDHLLALQRRNGTESSGSDPAATVLGA